MLMDPSAGSGGAQESRSTEGGGPGRRRVGITMQLDPEGNLWMVENSSRLVRLDPRTGEQKDFKLPDHPKFGVHEILIDRAGKISIFRVPTNHAMPYGQAIDKNDNVWAALWNSGNITKLDTTTNQWTEYTPPTHPGNLRRGPGVDSQNNVWFGIWAAGNRPGK